MSAVGDFIDGVKRGWRREMSKPKPDPVVSYWVNSMELQMKIAANKRYRRYQSDLQKRGRRARLDKPRRIEVVV